MEPLDSTQRTLLYALAIIVSAMVFYNAYTQHDFEKTQRRAMKEGFIQEKTDRWPFFIWSRTRQ